MVLKHSAHLYQEWQMLPMTLKTLKNPMFTDNDNKSLRIFKLSAHVTYVSDISRFVECEIHIHEVVLILESNFILGLGEFGTCVGGKPLHYKGTPFHCIIYLPRFMIQGVDGMAIEPGPDGYETRHI
ncbi:putative peptidylprolyl isomerase [Helianthus annuus]|nr:putative peptidylprolyl isomerase [Helianthus annuus]